MFCFLQFLPLSLSHTLLSERERGMERDRKIVGTEGDRYMEDKESYHGIQTFAD